MPVTQQDMAKSLGVSQALVARALRDDPAVAAATRARVQAMARKLGYRPNTTARALLTGKTGLVGLWIARAYGTYSARVIFALEKLAPKFENGLGGWADRITPLQGVYMDLSALELTRRLVERYPTWTIPSMNRMLVESALQYGVDHGATNAFLLADDCNMSAIALYRKVGFTPSEDDVQIDLVYQP